MITQMDMTFTNTATVTADNAGPVENGVDIYAMQPVFAVEKTADKENCYIGDAVEYTVALDQTTDDATAYDVTVTDELPDGLELIAAASETGEVEINGNIATVSYDAVSTSETITVTAKTLKNTGNNEITNTAIVTASNTDDATDNADIYVMQPELSITKTTDKDAYDTGDTVTYTIIAEQLVENAAEENVVITDTLPDGLTLSKSLDVSMGEIETNGNTITITIPELTYGETVTVTVKAVVDSGQEGEVITNTAYIKGGHTDKINDAATITINKAETVPDKIDSSTAPKTGQPVLSGVLIAIGGLAIVMLCIGVRRRKTW